MKVLFRGATILGLVLFMGLTATVAGDLASKGMSPGETFKDCAECPEMIVVPAGKYLMGTDEGEASERPKHIVTISQPFAAGVYEVTQAEWQALMGSNPSRNAGQRNPVENVSWNDAQAFIRKLNHATGQSYRLLSEAEWEYAARAGTTSLYPWGNGWGGDGTCARCSIEPSDNRTLAVGSFVANAFGLHDMHGNVWEWVEDCRNPDYGTGPETEAPRKTGDCSAHMLRGGAWRNIPRHLRTSDRVGQSASVRHFIYGFRVAKTL